MTTTQNSTIRWSRRGGNGLTCGLYDIFHVGDCALWTVLRFDGVLRDQPYHIGEFARIDEAKAAAEVDSAARVAKAIR